TIPCSLHMDGDSTVIDVVVDKEIGEAIGSERKKLLEDLFKSVKRWKKKEMRDLVKRYSKRYYLKELTLAKVIWNESELTRFLLIVYRDSFPSPLIGEKNSEQLMEFISSQLMASEKAKKGKKKYPPLLKYRFINWLKKLNCEREKRRIVQKISNYIVDYMQSIVKFGFKTITRYNCTEFVPMNQFRHLEKLCFIDYEKRCELTQVDQVGSAFDLKLIPVGSTVRPIVMKEKKKAKDRRRKEKIFLAGLRYHLSRFGVPSETLASCQKTIAAFSCKAKDEIFYLKSDIRKFFPSIDHSVLISLLRGVVQGDCVVATLECDKIVKGRKFLKIRNKGGADLESARKALFSSFNNNFRKLFNKKFTTTNISREHLLKTILSEIRHTVKYKDRVYRVGRGIGQGSIYSSLLGDIYLHERMKRMMMIIPRQSLLLSYADDFLFLSHLRHVVENFHQGILQEEMGIRGNSEKTITNVNGRKCRVLHWCGLTFHTTRFALIRKRSIKK
ncbi:hypothetical protein PENTCL1PPCAC_22123, partial [Pristionchus entomophagus]